MQNTAPALELRDIHLPVEPGFWPLAPGWWALIVVGIILGYLLARVYLQLRKSRQLNHLMQNELNAVNSSYQQHKNKHQLASDISQLLKRFVLHVLKDNDAAALSGEKWVDYLNQQIGMSYFDEHIDVLTTAQYTPDCDFDVPSIIAKLKNYFPNAIKKQKNVVRRKHND